MYYNISKNPQKEYMITESGEYIFYFENMSAKIHFIIDTQNADVYIYGFYHAKNTEKFNLKITQTHTAPNSHSTTLIKSIVDDTAQFSFTGKIRIEENAKYSKALLTNKNLLLSDKAHILSIPQLEVLPHEVECIHAATTAPLDPDQLHYLTSRGIATKESMKLLINGFSDEVRQHKKL